MITDLIVRIVEFSRAAEAIAAVCQGARPALGGAGASGKTPGKLMDAQSLLQEISDYCRLKGMAESTFGRGWKAPGGTVNPYDGFA